MTKNQHNSNNNGHSERAELHGHHGHAGADGIFLDIKGKFTMLKRIASRYDMQDDAHIIKTLARYRHQLLLERLSAQEYTCLKNLFKTFMVDIQISSGDSVCVIHG